MYKIGRIILFLFGILLICQAVYHYTLLGRFMPFVIECIIGVVLIIANNQYVVRILRK